MVEDVAEEHILVEQVVLRQSRQSQHFILNEVEEVEATEEIMVAMVVMVAMAEVVEEE